MDAMQARGDRAGCRFERRVTVAKRFAILAGALILSSPALAGDAKGTVVYKARTIDVKYAYVVQTTDAMSSKPMRRLVLSPKDIGAKIDACAKMSCVDGDLDDGIEFDFVDGPRLNYWLVMNGQKVQYSGTEPKESLVSTANDGKRIAGTLKFDKTSAGGPKVDVTFDAPMVKELK
jgi:hypothetical protein